MVTIRDNEGKSQAGQDLTDTQEKLITALLQYPTVTAAAASVGITDRTAHRYLAMPHFKAAYDAAKARTVQEIRNSIVALASKSITGLHELIEDPETPYATRLRGYQLAIERIVPVVEPAQPGQSQEAAQDERVLLALLNKEEWEEYEQHQAGIQRLLDTARARQEVKENHMPRRTAPAQEE